MTTISTRVREIVADVLCVIPETVNEMSTLDGLGIRDLLGMTNGRVVWSQILNGFNCYITYQDWESFVTVGDIIRFLEAREAEGRG